MTNEFLPRDEAQSVFGRAFRRHMADLGLPTSLSYAELELYLREPEHPLFKKPDQLQMFVRAANLCVDREFYFALDAYHALNDLDYDWGNAMPVAVRQLRKDIEKAVGPQPIARPRACAPMF